MALFQAVRSPLLNPKKLHLFAKNRKNGGVICGVIYSAMENAKQLKIVPHLYSQTFLHGNELFGYILGVLVCSRILIQIARKRFHTHIAAVCN